MVGRDEGAEQLDTRPGRGARLPRGLGAGQGRKEAEDGRQAENTQSHSFTSGSPRETETSRSIFWLTLTKAAREGASMP